MLMLRFLSVALFAGLLFRPALYLADQPVFDGRVMSYNIHYGTAISFPLRTSYTKPLLILFPARFNGGALRLRTQK